MPASPWSARALRALLAGVGFVPLMQACGGRSDTEDYLFGSDGVVAGSASSPSSAGRGGAATTAGRGPTPGGGVSVGGGISVGGSVSVGGTAIAVAGTSAVGGTVAVAGAPSMGGAVQGGSGTAAGGRMGSAGAPSVPKITCGSEICNADAESCCFTGGFHCIAKGKACGGAVLGCTTRADCSNGEVCCLSITGDVAEASSCQASCSVGTSRDRQLCDVASDCERPLRYCTPTVFGVNICTHRP
jgi:hypothetical protein